MLKGGGEWGKKSVFSQLFQCCISQCLMFLFFIFVFLGMTCVSVCFVAGCVLLIGTSQIPVVAVGSFFLLLLFGGLLLCVFFFSYFYFFFVVGRFLMLVDGSPSPGLSVGDGWASVVVAWLLCQPSRGWPTLWHQLRIKVDDAFVFPYSNLVSFDVACMLINWFDSYFFLALHGLLMVIVNHS